MSIVPHESPTPVALEKPSFKITGLHIRGLRAIRSLNLPEDGLGWSGNVPDLMIIGGVNGSGKTTLLECVFAALEHMEHFGLIGANTVGSLGEPIRTAIREDVISKIDADELWIDFDIEFSGYEKIRYRFLLGSEGFCKDSIAENTLGFCVNDDAVTKVQTGSPFRAFFREDCPNVVFLPSSRDLVLPETDLKTPRKKSRHRFKVARWERPETWGDSFEAELYDARWQYLNAKEEGRTEGRERFEAYNQEFDRFFAGKKKLAWDGATLVVRLRDGSHHALAELSSGEKQVVLMMGEILQHWRPGSLILIDEPELHLHTSWQTKLWEALTYWQKERGGQVIIATQSNHLFRVSEPGTKVLLSSEGM